MTQVLIHMGHCHPGQMCADLVDGRYICRITKRSVRGRSVDRDALYRDIYPTEEI